MLRCAAQCSTVQHSYVQAARARGQDLGAEAGRSRGQKDGGGSGLRIILVRVWHIHCELHLLKIRECGISKRVLVVHFRQYEYSSYEHEDSTKVQDSSLQLR